MGQTRLQNLIALGAPLVLKAIDSRKDKVAELRFFGGPNIDDTAEVLPGLVRYSDSS